jgi:L-cysteine/cystine lyase
VHERGSAGFEGIRHRADHLANLLSEIPRLTVRSPGPAQSGLVSFEIEDVEPGEVIERLLQQRFVVRYVPGPRTYIRASTHLFNTEDELEALAEAIQGM